jgi:NADH-quinone oxidoreductase subunit H
VISASLLLQVAATMEPSFGPWLVATLVKMLIIFTVYMVGVALLTLAERKVSAWIQDRHGPNRVGPGGLLQPAADGLKNIMKEETYPGQAYKPLFVLAPAMAFIPAMLIWAVIPFSAPWDSPWGRISGALAELPIGFLFILAIGSLGVYGIVLAGWSSNNKYSFLGGLRSSAQMVSYEIALGMSTIPVLLLAGNVSMARLVEQQAAMGWNALNVTLAFLTFIIAAFAETNRLPFDLPEAESELIAGYHSEYSAMKFSLFFIAEYANMVTMGALMATLFLGGWDLPFTTWDNVAPFTIVKVLATLALFVVKTLFFVFLFMWIRWTLPRFRYDQLMSLGWKVLLPQSLAYIVLIASAILTLDYLGVPRDWRFGMSLFGLNIVVLIALFFLLDRGRVISPASTRATSGDLERLRARSIRRSEAAD